MGVVMGRLTVWTINKIKLEQEGLYPALTLAFVIFTYAFTNTLNGNSFLAVYIAAVILGNKNFIHKRSLTKFYDGIAWLMQILMFLTLGLLVFPSHMVPVIGVGILISLFLIFVARPISVFLSMSFFRTTFNDKLYVSWVGLRGAVPIVFATYPMLAGVEKSEMIFNIVFFIVLTSVMLQGTTLSLVARWLGLSENAVRRRKYQFDLEMQYDIKNELTGLTVTEGSTAIGKSLVELQLPKTTLIVLINRDGKFLTPNGATVLETDDVLFVMTDSEQELSKVNLVLGL